MSNYTQGEWSISRYSGGEYGIYSEDGRDIVLIRDHGGEAEANAHLIAQAPELVKALRRCVIQLEAFAEQAHDLDVLAWHRKHIIDPARAVLRDALGEE